MIGSLTFNFMLALIGFFLVFTVSLTSNVVITSLIRGSFAFVLFFLIAFLIRMLMGMITEDKKGQTGKRAADNNEEKNKSDNEENNNENFQTDHKDLENDELSNDYNEENSSEDVIKRTSEYVRELMNEDDD